MLVRGLQHVLCTPLIPAWRQPGELSEPTVVVVVVAFCFVGSSSACSLLVLSHSDNL